MEEEEVIKNYNLNIRMCTESGIYKGENIAKSERLNNTPVNNKIQNEEGKKKTHNGKGTI